MCQRDVRRSSIRWSRSERSKAPELEDLHTSYLTGFSATASGLSGLPLDAAVDSPSSVLNAFLTGSDVELFPPSRSPPQGHRRAAKTAMLQRRYDDHECLYDDDH